MKKFKYLLLLCAIAMISTGCVKFNAKMNIKKDKSMEFSIVYALDKTVFGESKKLDEADFKEAEKEGFTVSKYTEGDLEGFTLTKTIKNIDDVSTDKDSEYDLSGMMSGKSDGKYIFKVEKGLFKDTYTAVLKFDANESGLSTSTGDYFDDDDDYLEDDYLDEGDFYDDDDYLDEDDDEDYYFEFEDDDDEDYIDYGDFAVGDEEDTDDGLTIGSDDDGITIGSDDSNLDIDYSKMSTMDLSFKVSLPYGAISNNATMTANGNKDLTWTLLSDKAATIEFKFAIYNMTLIYICGGALLAIIAVVLVLLLGKKGKKKYALADDAHLEIKNDANDNVVPGPVLKEEAHVENNDQE